LPRKESQAESALNFLGTKIIPFAVQQMAKLNVRQMILWTRTMEIGFAQDKVYGLGRRAFRLLQPAAAFDGGG